MGYPLIASPHVSDAGVISGAATPGSMALSNLLEPQPTDIARFSSLAGMYWEIDLGSPQEISYIWIGFSNASEGATIRHRAANSQAALTSAPGYDSGSVSHWPVGASLSGYAMTHHHHNLLVAPTGYGLIFDGVDDEVACGTSNAFNFTSGEYTMEGWIYVEPSIGAGGTIFARGDGSSTGFQLELSSAGANQALRLNHFSGSSWAQSMATIHASAWRHFAVTRSGSSILTYVDGLPGPSYTATSDPASASGSTLYIGRSSVATERLEAKVDELRIWNYARTPAQILANYRKEILSATGLVGRWGLNEGSGSTAADSSGTGANGAMSFSTWVAGAGIPLVNRWWRADIVDAANPAGYYQAGRLYYVPSSALWQASRGSGWGAGVGPTEEVRRIFSEGGQMFPRKRPRGNTIEIPFNGVPKTEAMGIVHDLGRLRGVSQDVLAVFDPDDPIYLQQLTAYGVMSEPLRRTNPRFDRWQTVTVRIEEMS